MIDKAKTAREAFDALNILDHIELKTSTGPWLVYQKTVWGFSRVSRPGYYNMPGESMVMIKDLPKYDGRWRKLSDHAKKMYNL